MNFRENDPKPTQKEKFDWNNWDSWSILTKRIKEWLFWRKARARHKYHAKHWAIFVEKKQYYPAVINSILGEWEFIGPDFYEWSSRHRDMCQCRTRYQALRRIAESRQFYQNAKRT